MRTFSRTVLNSDQLPKWKCTFSEIVNIRKFTKREKVVLKNRSLQNLFTSATSKFNFLFFPLFNFFCPQNSGKRKELTGSNYVCPAFLSANCSFSRD